MVLQRQIIRNTSQLTDEALTDIGKEIVAAVGSGLKSGDFLALAKESIEAVIAASDQSADDMNKKITILCSIEKHIDNLMVELDQYSQQISSQFDIYSQNIFALREMILLNKGLLSIYKNLELPTGMALLYLRIDLCFRKYFDEPALYTYCDLEKSYPGKFWEYFRSVKKAAGANFTEAAIMKARQRLWNDWLASGEVVQETKRR